MQGRIQDFFKEGVVSTRFQGKRPRAKGVGEGRVMFEYVDFLHLISEVQIFKCETLLRNKSTLQQQ